MPTTATLASGKLAYTITEAAQALGVSPRAMRRYIQEGRVKSFKWVGRTLIRTDDLQAAIDAASGR